MRMQIDKAFLNAIWQSLKIENMHVLKYEFNF